MTGVVIQSGEATRAEIVRDALRRSKHLVARFCPPDPFNSNDDNTAQELRAFARWRVIQGGKA